MQAELIAEPAAIKAGEPFWVGVRLRIQKDWHTYWRNARRLGRGATKIKWTLPPGWTASTSPGPPRTACRSARW